MSPSYDEHYAAGGFKYSAAQREWLKREVIDAFGLRACESVLDAGCGDGFWTGLLQSEGLRAMGIDYSAVGIRAATESFPDADFIQADLEKPLQLQRTFGAVFVRNLSHLLRADLAPAVPVLANLVNAVRDNGVLMVVQYSHRDGSIRGTAVNHPLSGYVQLVERVADIDIVKVVADYVLIHSRVDHEPR